MADEGYATPICSDGAAAADIIRSEQAVLAVLDLWLEQPKAGETVLALLHHDPATEHIPVILCADSPNGVAYLQPVLDKRRCGWLIKPFQIPDLLTTMAALLVSA